MGGKSGVALTGRKKVAYVPVVHLTLDNVVSIGPSGVKRVQTHGPDYEEAGPSGSPPGNSLRRQTNSR